MAHAQSHDGSTESLTYAVDQHGRIGDGIPAYGTKHRDHAENGTEQSQKRRHDGNQSQIACFTGKLLEITMKKIGYLRPDIFRVIVCTPW